MANGFSASSMDVAQEFSSSFQQMLDYTLKAEWDGHFLQELDPRVKINAEVDLAAQRLRVELLFNNRIRVAYGMQSLSDLELRNHEYMQYHAQRALKAIDHGFFALWFANVIPDPDQRTAFLNMLDSGQIDGIRWVKHPERPQNKYGYDSLVVLLVNGIEYREKIDYAKENWKEVLANIIIRKK